jgi:transposase
MRKIRELIRLKYEARLSHEQIAGALAISKGVVAKYVARIERTGLEPGALMAMSDAEVMARIAPAPRPASYGGRIKPDFAHLHAELKRPNVTLMLLWQEYSAANAGGLTYRYSQFADLYRNYVATLRRSMRQVHRAGEKLFVDYAGQSIAYGREGDRAQIFVATLGASNYTFACATAHQVGGCRRNCLTTRDARWRNLTAGWGRTHARRRWDSGTLEARDLKRTRSSCMKWSRQI